MGEQLLQTRQGQGLDKFLLYVANPFRNQFNEASILASAGSSLGISIAIFVLWCLIRPHNTVVYAPKLRNAGAKHAPPRLENSFFGWWKPLTRAKESDLVAQIGEDAVLFLRVLRMCRTIFFWLGLIGVGIVIPVNVIMSQKNIVNWEEAPRDALTLMSPELAWGQGMWAHVVMAYVFDIIIMYILFRNYVAVAKIRKNYFESEGYQMSLHSRTLMITDIPNKYRTDDGLRQIIQKVKTHSDGQENCVIGRNVKGLPELIEQHEQAVRKLEQHLAKYLKNPDSLPVARPTCQPAKDDKSIVKGVKVDAIEYHGQRIRDLEQQINNIRGTIESRMPMQYGFISYSTISQAHTVAKAAYGKRIHGASIYLAPKPNDIIWKNLGMPKSQRRWNALIGNVLFVALSILYVIPNALIATFLSDLSRIAELWDGFKHHFYANGKTYAFVQGFLAPVVTSIVYLLLPIVMRRLSKWQGDLTKTSRERHVTHKLYTFFVFNNLIIFAAFSTFWEFIATIIREAQKNGENPDVWKAIKEFRLATKLVTSIFGISSFWVMYLLQRNMGAVLDIAQLVSLFWTSFARRFLSPTPRQIIERTAPPTFDYASYYNYFLFYTTIALSFATLQPIILIVAFLYFQVDSWLKKYLLMYVFVSKVESGGAFWRLLFNRFLFAAAFSNLIVGIVVWVQYDASYACFWVIPLPIFLIGFKWYCRRKFDDAMHFHTKGSDRESIIAAAGGKIASSRNDKLRTRFGNPALYRPLIVPMVHKKAQHVLAKVYQGRLNSERIIPSMYGDVDLDMMQSGGKAGRPMRPLDGQFKLVEENELYFENWKGRDEFMGGHAGGEMYNQGYGYESGLNTPSGLPHEYGGGSPSSLRAATPADFTRGGNPDYHLNLPGAASFNSRPNSPQMRPRSGLGISTYHAGYDPVPLGSSSQPGTPHFAPLGSPGFAPVPYSQQYQQHPHHQSQLHSRGPSPNPLQNLDVQSIRSGYSDGASSSHYQQPYIQQQQPHQPHQFPQQQYHDPQPQPQPQQGYPFQPADTMRENLIPGLPHLPPPGQGQGSGGGYEEFRKGGF